MTPRPSSLPDTPDAPRAQGSGRSLPWLLAIFVISMGLILGLRGLFADLNDELQRRSANERARLFIGEEIVQGIQAIESHLYQMAVTHNAAGYQRILREIDEQLAKIHHDLNVLQQGGTARRSLRLNITELQEIAQEVIFQPSAEDKQLVMEQIEVGSKLDQVKEMIGELEDLLKQRWEALEKDDLRAFYRIEQDLSLRLKRAPPYFERLNENANRLFVEGERRLDALEEEVRAKREQLGRMETALIALVLFLATAIGFQFLRRLKFALDEAQRFGKEVAYQKTQVATILDTLSDGVYATDLQGRITFLNTAAERMFGWSAGQLLGQPAHAATHHTRPDGMPYPADECPLFGMLKLGQPLDGEEWFVHRDGHCFPVSFRSNPLQQDGVIIGSLISFQDIGAKRAAEARIRLLEMAIQESDQGILITAADATEEGGTIQYVNSGFTQITGYAATDAVGQRTALLRGPTTDPATVNELIIALQSGQHFQSDIDYRRKDGSLLVAEINYSPVHDSEGHLTHFIALLSDIGIRRAAEQALRDAHDQALAHARLKSEFLANMSHEIRTPMNGVIGMTDLLLDTPLNAEQRDFALLVRDSAHSLLTILNDILDFSKIEAGKLDIEVVDLSLVRIVEGVADLLAPKAHEKHLSLMSFVDPALAGILRGDSTRLRQILLNLIGNAIKFTSQGDVAVIAQPVQKLSSPDAVRVRFEIRDSGIGISPAGQARLFQSFSQADSSTTRKFGGTGLGLAISKQLVTLMGGEIGVISTEGEGSTFWFELPLATTEAPVPVRHAMTDVTAQPQHVLVVDDRATDRTILRRYLTSWGLSHDSAADGPAALAELRRAATLNTPYTAALLDYRMPGMNGFELAAAIQADPQLATTRLVLLTAYDERALFDQARALGFTACLSKPVRQSELFNSLIDTSVQKEEISTTDIAEPSLISGNRRDALAQGRLVLLVEDNLTNQKLAKILLQKLGYETHIVANGQQAVEAVDTLPFAAILMDCQMPVMDGFEATTMIRKAEASDGRSRIPIIAMTANAMQGDRERCLAVGMDDYLSKPINPDQLRLTLAQWARNAPQAAQQDALTEAPQIASTAAPDNFSKLRDLCGNDEAIVAEILGLFIDRMPVLLDTFATAITAQDVQQVKGLAHEAKGSCANLGLDDLTDLSRQIEHTADTNDWARVEKLRAELATAYERVAAHIQTTVSAGQ